MIGRIKCGVSEFHCFLCLRDEEDQTHRNLYDLAEKNARKNWTKFTLGTKYFISKSMQ
jgi:hypothetical protein